MTENNKNKQVEAYVYGGLDGTCRGWRPRHPVGFMAVHDGKSRGHHFASKITLRVTAISLAVSPALQIPSYLYIIPSQSFAKT